jgi:hypothetical protein
LLLFPSSSFFFAIRPSAYTVAKMPEQRQQQQEEEGGVSVSIDCHDPKRTDMADI